MYKLRFGTAGIPISTEGGILEGIKKVKELGLDEGIRSRLGADIVTIEKFINQKDI